jgi:hypothetical protein
VATSPRLTIAHVTPYTWGHTDEVNEFAGRSAAELSERGHRVVIAAPVPTRKAVRESLKGIDRARDDVRSLFGPSWTGERVNGDGPPIVGIGQGIPMPRGPKPRAAPFPLDVSGTLEQLLSSVPFDIVHVHDPFAPSAASGALRHSRALNVGSFHEPTERIL